jgi:hypothetical protein
MVCTCVLELLRKKLFYSGRRGLGHASCHQKLWNKHMYAYMIKFIEIFDLVNCQEDLSLVC